MLIEGCALDGAPRKATRASVIQLVRDLGFLQVDSISSVERAHHLILHTRLDGYTPALLTHHTERSRELFEHWTHDASLIRTDWLPWWTARFEHNRARMESDAWMRARLGPQWKKVVREVRKTLEARGPLATRDFPRPASAEKSEGWWNWSPHKAALEFLWRAGEVAVHGRRGFEKIYDLSERVHGPQPEQPARAAVMEWACREAFARLGAATASEVSRFMHAVTIAEANRWCASAVKSGALARVLLERGNSAPKPGFARLEWKRDAAAVKLHKQARLLAPFDPLIRDRARLVGLFGFHYRFEAFVPAAKRVHGYYTMPVLVGDALVGRVDLASDRAAGVLRVARVWAEQGVTAAMARREIRVACARLADQLALELAYSPT